MVGHFLQPNRRNRSSVSQQGKTSNVPVASSTSTASSNCTDPTNHSNHLPMQASSLAGTQYKNSDTEASINNRSEGDSSILRYDTNCEKFQASHDNHSSTKSLSNNQADRPTGIEAAQHHSTTRQPTRQGATTAVYNSKAQPSSFTIPQNLTAESVAALPPPGLSSPTAIEFSPKNTFYKDVCSMESSSVGEYSRYVVFVSKSIRVSSAPQNNGRRARTASNSRAEQSVSTAIVSSSERQLCALDLQTYQIKPLLKLRSKRRHDGGQQQNQKQLLHHQSSSSSVSASALEPTSSPSADAAAELSATSLGANTSMTDSLSLEERLRRERQRMHSSGGLTQFTWTHSNKDSLRILVPIRGSLYVQDGVESGSHLRVVYDKHFMEKTLKQSKSIPTSAIDPQLSPDGQLFAFCAMGEIFVAPCHECRPPTQITFGADLKNSITHGLADFVAQEEMDRYRGFWWSPDSKGIVFARVDESKVPSYRITHHECETTTSESCMYEDHRYPFAGKANPTVKLAYVRVTASSLVQQEGSDSSNSFGTATSVVYNDKDSQKAAEINWNQVKWFNPPREAQEYLARLDFLPDGSACAQWQNRTQNCLVLVRMDLNTGRARTLLVERSDIWINLHHLLHVLERPIHPRECRNSSFLPPLPDPLPEGSFSFLFGSERSGYCHLYLYTHVPGVNGGQAMLIRQVTTGDWMVESIVGVNLKHNAVYVTGTYDSVLERHLYALPIVIPEVQSSLIIENNAMETENPSDGHSNGVRRGFKQVMNALAGKSNQYNGSRNHSSSQEQRFVYSNSTGSATPPESIKNLTESACSDMSQIIPLRLTKETGMHNVVMDPDCTKIVDTSSDLGRPNSVKIYELPVNGPFPTSDFCSFSRPKVLELKLLYTLYDARRDDKSLGMPLDSVSALAAPELLTFPSSDGAESLHAALYRPDSRIHGPGPYPLICAVYGGPHVQRVNRSWSQCADMRAQRLRSLGFCVVKCDNRGSSRRGLAFESAISRRLGRLEVLDQVAVVRQLSVRGIIDPSRVGIYGWSYGGYLAAMCLCRAPDVFHVAVAGAPVTSWDGYDTHYTERYMGLPSENPSGYRESAVFDHVPNMRGRLLLVHGLIDENVHFRHTARLINRLVAAGKDYDLLLFPDERHSPRRLRDRIYMEQRISDYFLKHLSVSATPPMGSGSAMRTIAGL